MVKINFSKDEYRALLDMIYIADWIMHSSDIDCDDCDHDAKYNGLRKKILSYFKEMDAEDCIVYNDNDKEYYETRSYEDELHSKYIDPHDDENFWDELINRLTKRDAINKIGLDSFNEMGMFEQTELVLKARKVYEDEFAITGINNLLLVKDSDRH